MKILIYTPLDETFEYTHGALVDGILTAGIKQWMSPVLFAHYLRETKKANTVEESIFKGIITTNQQMLNYEQLPDNIVIIGNCSRDFKFDLIIGYTQNTDFSPQSELLLDAMRKKYADEKQLNHWLNDLYKPKDCESFLFDTKEVVKFVERVLNERRAK